MIEQLKNCQKRTWKSNGSQEPSLKRTSYQTNWVIKSVIFTLRKVNIGCTRTDTVVQKRSPIKTQSTHCLKKSPLLSGYYFHWEIIFIHTAFCFIFRPSKSWNKMRKWNKMRWVETIGRNRGFSSICFNFPYSIRLTLIKLKQNEETEDLKHYSGIKQFRNGKYDQKKNWNPENCSSVFLYLTLKNLKKPDFF